MNEFYIIKNISRRPLIERHGKLGMLEGNPPSFFIFDCSLLRYLPDETAGDDDDDDSTGLDLVAKSRAGRVTGLDRATFSHSWTLFHLLGWRRKRSRKRARQAQTMTTAGSAMVQIRLGITLSLSNARSINICLSKPNRISAERTIYLW